MAVTNPKSAIGKLGTNSPPPARMLPNGIPMSRLEHLKAVQDTAAKKAKGIVQMVSGHG